MTRWELFFSGHVQGVGFRYSTQAIADRFQVTGFVRNLPDGRVHLVAEGEATEVAKFVGQVRRTMVDRIRDETCDKRPATGEFRSFRIAF